MPVDDEPKVVNLFVGDPRLGEFAADLQEFIHERAGGFPIPSVLGVMDIVKDTILQEAKIE